MNEEERAISKEVISKALLESRLSLISDIQKKLQAMKELEEAYDRYDLEETFAAGHNHGYNSALSDTSKWIETLK